MAGGDPKEWRRLCFEQILQRDAGATAESVESGIRYTRTKFRLHIPSLHQNRDGVEEQECDKWLQATSQVEIQREFTEQPESE